MIKEVRHVNNGDYVRNNFNPDMKQFERLFKKNFPGLQSMDIQDWSNVNSIESYVQKMLNHSFKQAGMENSLDHHFLSEVFETHDRVIVKMDIPKKTNLDEIRLYVNGNQIKLINMNETQFVKLPSFVNSKTARALYKDGILQIQMKKQSKSEHYREIFIRSS